MHWALTSLSVKLGDQSPLPGVALGPKETRDAERPPKGHDANQCECLPFTSRVAAPAANPSLSDTLRPLEVVWQRFPQPGHGPREKAAKRPSPEQC